MLIQNFQILKQEHIGAIMYYISAEVEAYNQHIKKSNAAAAQNSDDGDVEGSDSRGSKYDFSNVIFRALQTKKGILFSNFSLSMSNVDRYSPYFSQFNFSAAPLQFLDNRSHEVDISISASDTQVGFIDMIT
jgi:hypothetical protein